MEPLFWFFAFWLFAGVFAVALFFVLSARRLLLLCAPECRTIHPKLVWLTLVPPIYFVFDFFLVLGVESTLENEFRRRQMTPPPNKRKAVGLIMCVSGLVALISRLLTSRLYLPFVPIAFLAFPVGCVHLVCFVRYWVYIVETRRALSGMTPAVPPPSPGPSGPSTR